MHISTLGYQWWGGGDKSYAHINTELSPVEGGSDMIITVAA